MQRTALIKSQLGRDSCSHVFFFGQNVFVFFSIVNHACESAFLSVLKSKSGKKRTEFAVSLSGAEWESGSADGVSTGSAGFSWRWPRCHTRPLCHVNVSSLINFSLGCRVKRPWCDSTLWACVHCLYSDREKWCFKENSVMCPSTSKGQWQIMMSEVMEGGIV